MARELWTATLDSSSPRYADWRKILGSDKVPLVSPASVQAKLGDETCEVYLLDWQGLNGVASQRLLKFLAAKFCVEMKVIEEDLDRDGHFPIRATDVFVSFSLAAFI